MAGAGRDELEDLEISSPQRFDALGLVTNRRSHNVG
jgi:hypothetical protein